MVAVIRKALLVAVALLVPVSTAQAATCAPVDTTGGEWPVYSGTLDGTRQQLAEATIGAANVSQLATAWKLPAPDGGLIHSTPTVAGGCVFFGTDLGDVYSVNADTGAVVWQVSVGASSGSNTFEGAGIVGAPAISGGRVFVGATTPNASVLSALDQTTGAIVWQTVIDDDPGGGLDSSPVPYDGKVFQAFKGDESSDHSHPGFAIVDAATGAILAKTHVIPQADFDAGYRGGSIVNTPAIDLEHKLVFAGTGNPASVQQHPLTDAQLKIDGDPLSGTFGTIVGSHRGTSDSYPAPSDVDTPTCESDLQWPVGRFSCAQLDYNFLASGSLWRSSSGRQIFGELQKSGVYTAVYTDTMEEAWHATLSLPCFACNLSSSGVDANGVYVAVTGGNLYSLNRDTGAIQWATALTGGMRYNGLAIANGVVYSLNDSTGTLEAFDTATGVPKLAHAFTSDTQTPMQDMGNSSGVSVARNTVFATSQWNSQSTLFALKLGGAGGGGGLPQPPPLPPPPSGGGAASDARIVTGPNAATIGYATPIATMTVGRNATYTNTDIVRHNVTATARGADGKPLFQSDLVSTGGSAPVRGVEKLAPGTYQFFCQPHPNMKGQLVVR